MEEKRRREKRHRRNREEKDREAENEGNRKNGRRMSVWREAGIRGARGGEGEAHSSTLHYVRHFPEDSLGNENREDVGKRRGRGETRGGGQINT